MEIIKEQIFVLSAKELGVDIMAWAQNFLKLFFNLSEETLGLKTLSLKALIKSIRRRATNYAKEYTKNVIKEKLKDRYMGMVESCLLKGRVRIRIS